MAERIIDNLGRVVIPIDIRRKLDLKPDSRVSVTVNEDSVVITPLKRRCALCGKGLMVECSIRLCSDCIRLVKTVD